MSNGPVSKPMLATDVPVGALDRLLADPAWGCQLKMDGDRGVLRFSAGAWRMSNRRGEPASRGIPTGVLAQLNRIPEQVASQVVFDGELMGDKFVAFDLVGPGSFAERFELLSGLFEALSLHGGPLVLIPLATGEPAKRALLEAAEANRREGVIFRRLTATYQAGRSDSLLRHKFTREIDCIIDAVNLDGHQNVRLCLLDPEGNRIAHVGRASAIGKKPTPAPGQVWSIRFLYVTDDTEPRLYQPRLVRFREDKAYEECLYAQLVGAKTNKEVPA